MEPLDDSLLSDFLVDSHEGLDHLDRDLVALEQDPASPEPLARAFRALHTIKGTCSFLGFRRLERVAHAGEHILASVRSGRLALTPEVVEGLLAVVDTVRRILAGIESERREPEGDDTPLFESVREWVPAAKDAGVKAAAGAGRPAKPEPPAPAEPAEPAEPVSAIQQQHVRVDVRRLDQIMDLVGELVLARNQLLESVTAGSATPASRAAQRLDHVTTRLQDEVMRTRMQPVSALWARLPRLVRDVAAACGRSVRLEMQGDATELDRTLMEALKDPLTHLVRNAVDHGIEPAAERERAGKPPEGVLTLRAFQEDGSVHLLLSDDGAGMSLERIRAQAIARGLVEREHIEHLSEHEWLQFVFLPGFSTAAEVTRISGRGVGLDAARAAIEAIGGTIHVATTHGCGTTFHIRLPLTLAIIPALTVEEGGDCHAIPQAHLLELVRLGGAPAEQGSGSGARIERAHDREVHRLRGELLPVVRLARVFAGPDADVAAESTPRHLLVLSAQGRRFGLAVTRVRDTEEIVVKPLHPRLREGGLFAGATVRGDGRVALILDVQALAAHAGLERTAPGERAAEPDATPAAPPVPLLLVRARSGHPAAVRVAEVDRIVELEPAAFERFGDRPALRLEGEVLPVAALAGDLPLAGPETLAGERTWPVLLHRRKGRRHAVVVDVVEDIVEWPGAPDTDRVVIRDRVTDLVSLAAGTADADREAA